jgi:lipopolysaccharide export system permease protein
MTIATSYLMKTFVKVLALVLPVFVTLYLVVEFVERLDDFLERQAPLRTVALYFAFRTPIVAVQVGSLGVLLSVTVTIALLERSREVIALLAAGASPLRIAFPFLLCAVIMAGVTLIAEEYILPGAHRAVLVLQAPQGSSKSETALVQQGEVWYRAPDAALVHLELVDPAAEHVHGLTMYRRSRSGEILEEVEASEAVWTNGRWTLLQGSITRFSHNLAEQTETFAQRSLAIGLDPEDLRSMLRPPSSMSISDLRAYLRKLRGRGVDVLAYMIDFQSKLATPLMHVTMALIALAAMWGARSARHVSLGIASTFGAGAWYWLLVTTSVSLGRSQQIALPLAIWLPHLAVLGLSAYLFWRTALV